MFIPAKNSHKGENGKLLIIAGSKQYHGSAVLAIQAAKRFVDLVYFQGQYGIEKNALLALEFDFTTGTFRWLKWDWKNNVWTPLKQPISPGVVEITSETRVGREAGMLPGSNPDHHHDGKQYWQDRLAARERQKIPQKIPQK
ncbi:MAG: hypothetical protein QXL47_00375 [Candidatus Anstonellales archaeon]